MKLVIVHARRAYVRPLAAAPTAVADLLRAALPAAFVPDVRWAGPVAADQGFVLDDVAFDPDAPTPVVPVVAPGAPPPVVIPPLPRATRIAMMLEYLADATPTDRPAVLFVPADDLATLADLRAAAIALHGPAAVDLRRLTLSTTADAVLHALGSEAPDDAGPAIVADQLGLPLPAAWIRNYTLAVLRLAERRLAATSLFATDRRAERVTMLLEASGLLIRPNVPADQILRELEPGGELFLLLTRPTPPPLSLFSSPEVA